MKRILHSAVGIIAVGSMLSSPLLINAQNNAFEPITNTFGDIVPQQGIYTELSGFTIQFSSGFQSDYIESMGYTKKVTLIDETSNALITDCTVKGGTGKVTVTLDQTVTEPGHYILLVPEGALGWEDEWGNFEEVQEMRFRLWVEKNEFEPISGRYGTVDPEQGIYSSLKEITLTMEAYSSDYLEAGTKKITLMDETTNETVATFSVKPGTGKVILSLPEEFTVPGHYIMQVPEGALGYEDDWYGEWNDCPAMQFRYWIDQATGMESLTPAENAVSDVYSITGTCVLKNASRNDLRNLPAGIYIHNGKKIAIR